MSQKNVGAIGVDIGGTKIAAGLLTINDADAPVLHHVQTVTTPVHQVDAILDAVTALCSELVTAAQQSGITLIGVGIGTAGQVNPATGVISYSNDNVPGWTGTPVGAIVSEALNLPVAIDNDVNALAIGEGRFGAGKAYANILYIAVGTGIGGAIVHNGRIWRGAAYSAGEVGYLIADWHTNADGTRKPITVEQLASGPGLERQYQRLSNDQERLKLEVIAQRAQDGEPIAQQVITQGASILGTVLAPVICLLDPEIVIVGGGVPNIGDLWWQPFETAIRALPLPATQNVTMAKAALNTNAIVTGAGWMALDELS